MSRVLDACCGSRMFHFDKNNKDVVFMDNRDFEDVLCDGRKLEVHPDIVADFKNIPFDDNSFNLVIFDPPHLIKVGKNSYTFKKYGKLPQNWREELTQGFIECFRVLKPNGVLVFKWSEVQIKLSEVLKCCPQMPLFGRKRGDPNFLAFMKESEAEGER